MKFLTPCVPCYSSSAAERRCWQLHARARAWRGVAAAVATGFSAPSPPHKPLPHTHTHTHTQHYQNQSHHHSPRAPTPTYLPLPTLGRPPSLPWLQVSLPSASEARYLGERLLEVVRHLHSVGVIHTDIRIDHFYLVGEVRRPRVTCHLRLAMFGHVSHGTSASTIYLVGEVQRHTRLICVRLIILVILVTLAILSYLLSTGGRSLT